MFGSILSLFSENKPAPYFLSALQTFVGTTHLVNHNNIDAQAK